MKVNSKQGFTLIEVLLALVVICIVISGFSRLIYSNMKAKKLTNNKYIIMNWAQTVIEYMKTVNLEEYKGEYNVQDFPELLKYKVDFPGIDNLIRKVKIIINNYSEEDLGENLFQIDVCIEGQNNSRIKNYELSTLVYKDE